MAGPSRRVELALKFSVAFVLAFVHREGEAATTSGGLDGTRGLGQFLEALVREKRDEDIRSGRRSSKASANIVCAGCRPISTLAQLSPPSEL